MSWFQHAPIGGEIYGHQLEKLGMGLSFGHLLQLLEVRVFPLAFCPSRKMRLIARVIA